MTATVHLALGSNLGDRLGHLRAAVAALEDGGLRVTARSPVYETAPMYVTDQPAFLNMALAAETALEPHALLALAKRVEAALGRRSGGVRFGPREVDVDVLLCGDRTVDSGDLVVPHPRMAERAFVLRPLADIAAAVRHPVLDQTIAELLAQAPGGDTVVPYQGPADAPD